MIQANNCILLVDLENTGDFVAILCIKTVRINTTTSELPSTKYSDGRFRDYIPNISSYTLDLEGASQIADGAGTFDIHYAQIGFVKLPYQLTFIDDSGEQRVLEGTFIVASSELSAVAAQTSGFNHTFTGKGQPQYLIDGEPGDEGSPGDGDNPGEEGDCDVIIHDDLLDITMIPNVPLQPDQYLVSLNDIEGTYALIGWRIDGGVWHWESSPSFLLPFLDNGSYTIDFVAQCANGSLGAIVTKTLDVAIDPPADCDGTIDDWSFVSEENPDGSFTVTFTVVVSSPTEEITSMQYKLDSGPNMDIWIARPVVDGVAVFTDTVPDLAFAIDLRTRCASGGFGFSVEDGGTIPEPTTCSATVEIFSYYLTYSFDTYSASAVMNYILSVPIEDILEIQWLSTITGAWVKVADAAQPVIVIPVVPGTITNQQFRVLCDASHFGPIETIQISVPIKQAQLDSRIINYTDTGAHYDVIINGTTNISQGNVAANNITEFNYYGILNVPVTVRLTLDTPIDPDACVLITNNTTYTGTIDGGDPNSIDFSVTVTYGIVIAFWAAVIEDCPVIVDFTGYTISHDPDAPEEWVIFPIYTVTANTDPTAVIQYWNGFVWADLIDADSFTPARFYMPDDTTTTIKLRAKCSAGVYGAESSLSVTTPEYSTSDPIHSVINYSYTEQTVIILQNGVEIFNEVMPARTSQPITLTYWDAGEEIKITTSPGYPRIPSDTPDDTTTWYTQIRNGDTYMGSYTHDGADDHSILVNGAGVDLTEGVVFTIQAAATPFEIFDPVVTSVDYTFDPDTGEFIGTPIVTGADYYEYSTDEGATWTLVPAGDPFTVTGASEFDEIWVRGTTADQSESGGTFTVLVEITGCAIEFTDLDYTVVQVWSDGIFIWYVQYVFTNDAPLEDFGTFVSHDGVEDYVPVLSNVIYAHSTLANDSTNDVEFYAYCNDSGTYGPHTHIEVVVPDSTGWTPTYNTTIFNYKDISEDVTIYADADGTPVLAYSGTIAPRTKAQFNFPTGLSGLITKVTLGTGFPDPFTSAVEANQITLQKVFGYDYASVIDGGDAHSLLFTQPTDGDIPYGVIFSIT